MNHHFWLIRALLVLATILPLASGAFALADSLEAEFAESIQPLLKKHCTECHSGDTPEAKFDVTDFYDPHRVAKHLASWQSLVLRVVIGDMPPADQDHRPEPDAISKLTSWTQRFRQQEAETHRDDPGIVGMRRLNNAEYNYAIRDLIGFDIQPTKTFPIDPANEAGFDNSAESLTMTPALASKYLEAARFVAEHLILASEGIRFASYPVVTETDRDKYCVQRIVDFYRSQPTNLADYFLALWEWQRSQRPIKDIAHNNRVSERYLRKLSAELFSESHEHGPFAEFQEKWDQTVASCATREAALNGCKALSEYVSRLRKTLSPIVPSLKGPNGLHEGSQTLVLWHNRELARQRRSCRTDIFSKDGVKSGLLERDRDSLESKRDEIRRSYEQFCSLFPNDFLILERGRHYAKEESSEGKGRLLSAGFHSMMGFFRDDQPLRELILDEEENRELDQLWRELEIISLTPVRQYAGFIWFERAESSFIRDPQFHFVRAEDKSVNSEVMIQRFADVYLEKVKNGNPKKEIVEAVETYFRDMNRQLRHLEAELQLSEPKHLDSMIRFAERAFRRPLSKEEDRDLRNFYEASRASSNADHRSAIEDTLVAILASPRFLYRWDLKVTNEGVASLSETEFASRLSFFLWGSVPDEALMRACQQGMHLEENARKAQVNRMIADSRAKGMVREFLGNWLEFRRFDSHNGVDRERFPSFDDALRRSMADEPVEFFFHLLQNDGTLNDLIDSKFLIINSVLAKHYGIPLARETHDKEVWERVVINEDTQRGGVIPMGVFLTQNSPGLRTSPVKRGYWVVKRLLGEKIPPPPPNVPELPNSEHDTGDLTLRELLEKHREHPSCAACHNRFDAAGLLLEGFDPIGRPRATDLGGRVVSTMALLPEGDQAEGLAGLKSYVMKKRFSDFRRNFCESLIAYALGRTLIVSDDLLVEEMIRQMDQNENRIRVAFDVIIQSRQFQTKRGTPSFGS